MGISVEEFFGKGDKKAPPKGGASVADFFGKPEKYLAKTGMDTISLDPDTSVPWTETIGAAGRAGIESAINVAKSVGSTAVGLMPFLPKGVEPALQILLKEKHEAGEEAERLRERQTGLQNIATGAITMAPYVAGGAVKTARRALSFDLIKKFLKDPSIAPEVVKRMVGAGTNLRKAIYGESALENIFKPFAESDPEALAEVKKRPIEHLVSIAGFTGGSKLVSKGLTKPLVALSGKLKTFGQFRRKLNSGADFSLKPSGAALEILPPGQRVLSVGRKTVIPHGLPKNVVSQVSSITATTDAIVDTARKAISTTKRAGAEAAKEIMGEHHTKIRGVEWAVSNYKKIIDKVVKKENQEAFLMGLEQGGKGWQRNFSKGEKAAFHWMRGEWDKLNAYALENGIISKGLTTPGLKHITHWWKNPNTGKPYPISYGRFAQTTPLQKKRTFSTIQAGLAKGFELATTNAGEILGKTWESLYQAKAAKDMLTALYNVEAKPSAITMTGQLRKKPLPLNQIEDWTKIQAKGLTNDYRRIGLEDMSKWMKINLEEGGFYFMKKPVGVRNELYPFVKDYFAKPSYSKIEELNFVAKQWKLGWNFFHHGALGWQSVSSNWNLNVPGAFVKGNRLIKNPPPELKLLYEQGLNEAKRFTGYADINYGKLFQIKPGGKLRGITNKALRGAQIWTGQKALSSFLFDYYQPGLKTQFVHSTYLRGLRKALKEGKTKEQWARQSVKAGEAFFSGEDIRRAMLESWGVTAKIYFNPTGRRFALASMLSPTWQREHLLSFGRIFKSLTPEKVGKMTASEANIYRKYLTGAMTIYTAANLANFIVTKQMDGKGRYMFQNPGSKVFHNRLNFNYPDGSPAYGRFMKSEFEIPEVLYEVIGKTLGFEHGGEFNLDKVWRKFSPWIHTAYKQMSNRAYFGPIYGDNKRSHWWRAPDLLSDIFGPISLSSIGRVMKGKLPIESLKFSPFGIPISKGKREKGGGDLGGLKGISGNLKGLK